MLKKKYFKKRNEIPSSSYSNRENYFGNDKIKNKKKSKGNSSSTSRQMMKDDNELKVSKFSGSLNEN
jgi:hypothetical protein